MFPEASRDGDARFDFLANLHGFLGGRVLPKVREAYERKVKPDFAKAQRRASANSHEVRRAMAGDPSYQTWSALRRSAMEMRQPLGLALAPPAGGDRPQSSGAERRLATESRGDGIYRLRAAHHAASDQGGRARCQQR
jgi:hypothetical protein